jgi:hypothetical protein
MKNTLQPFTIYVDDNVQSTTSISKGKSKDALISNYSMHEKENIDPWTGMIPNNRRTALDATRVPLADITGVSRFHILRI